MTKRKIAWITDSTAYMTDDLKQNPDVYVVPLEIIFGEDAYEDGIDLSTDELYARIRREKDIPKTSQPSSGKFAALFETLKDEYESAIAVHLSSKLSGTLSSCKAGGEMADFKLETVDSKSMSYAITHLIYKGMELADEGKELAEIAESLRSEVEKSNIYVLLGSLEQFYKGGRMSGTQYLLGSILKIKPIIEINRQGEFNLAEKVRSEKKAMNRLVELLKESYEKYQINEVQIMHGNVPDKAKELEVQVKAAFPGLNVLIGDISSTIAAHAGEGTLGILWHNQNI
jgi:DegV family protein with EDD domain